MLSTEIATNRSRRAAVLLAKSSITGASAREMGVLAQRLADTGLVERAVFAFSEQGLPTFRETLTDLVADTFDEIVLLAWTLPMEPGFRVWINRMIQQWREKSPAGSWPVIRIAPEPASLMSIEQLMREMVMSPFSQEVPALRSIAPAEGSLVPVQKRRVLVCQGGPCNNAGAPIVWGHLRNEQKRLDLRTTGDGVMTAKTSCLGPCNLAPVLQVFPEGTYYGGVDEAGIDRIIAEHLLGGRIVQELAYAAQGEKQRLRAPG